MGVAVVPVSRAEAPTMVPRGENHTVAMAASRTQADADGVAGSTCTCWTPTTTRTSTAAMVRSTLRTVDLPTVGTSVPLIPTRSPKRDSFRLESPAVAAYDQTIKTNKYERVM